MSEAGLRTSVDVAANVWGCTGSKGSPGTLLVGSHYDTVVDGGRFDGALGVLAGVAAAKAAVLAHLAALGGVEAAQVLRAVEIATLRGEDIDIRDVSWQRDRWFPRVEECYGKESATSKSPTCCPRSNSFGTAASGKGAQCLVRLPVRLPPFCVIAFSDEEGVRFQSTFLGSRVVAGSLGPSTGLGARDRDGRSVQEVLWEEWQAGRSRENGKFDETVSSEFAEHSKGSDLASILRDSALPPSSVRAYVELHAEQGPQLSTLNMPLAAVGSIAGQSRWEILVHGTQGHAGTVPMALRRDALAASAHIVTSVERICREMSGLPAEAGGNQEDRDSHTPPRNLRFTSKPPPQSHLVCTVGSLQPHPDASNVIAGRVRLTLDVRSDDDALRRNALDRIRRASEALCDARGASCTLMQVHEADAVTMDPGMREVLSEAARRAVQATGGAGEPGVDSLPVVIPTLTSGAGHDAMALAPVFPSAMLFVRDREGVSHSPLEHVEGKDVTVGARALFEALMWHAATVDDGGAVVLS